MDEKKVKKGKQESFYNFILHQLKRSGLKEIMLARYKSAQLPPTLTPTENIIGSTNYWKINQK